MRSKILGLHINNYNSPKIGTSIQKTLICGRKLRLDRTTFVCIVYRVVRLSKMVVKAIHPFHPTFIN